MTDRGSADETMKMSDDMVFFGQGGSMPRDLYLRGRRLVKLYWIAALSPLVLLIAGALTPDAGLISGAKLLNGLFWAHFKQVSIGDCAGKCHMVAYSLVGIPISWLTTVVVAIWAIPLALQNWQAGQEAFRLGAAPCGRAANGEIRQPPGLGWGIVGTIVFGASLFGVSLVLYLLGGSDRTVSRGREISPTLISIWITIFMGFAQFFAVALMGCATVATLSFKKRLNW